MAVVRASSPNLNLPPLKAEVFQEDCFCASAALLQLRFVSWRGAALTPAWRALAFKMREALCPRF
jgi:hypothetical protein